MKRQEIREFLNIRNIENTLIDKNVTFILRGTSYSITLSKQNTLIINRIHKIEFKTLVLVDENNQLLFLDDNNNSVYSINTELSSIKIFTVDETASLLKVTKRTIYTYVAKGYLKGFKIGSYWRVTEEELRGYIARGGSSERIE